MDSKDIVLIDDQTLAHIKVIWPFAHYAIACMGRIKHKACLQHEETNPHLIQYFYVNEILKKISRMLAGQHLT